MDMGIGWKLPRIDQPQYRITAAPQAARGGEANAEPQEVFQIPSEVLEQHRIDWSSPKFADLRKKSLIRHSETLMRLQEVGVSAQKGYDSFISHNNSRLRDLEESLKNLPSSSYKERVDLMNEISAYQQENKSALHSKLLMATSNSARMKVCGSLLAGLSAADVNNEQKVNPNTK